MREPYRKGVASHPVPESCVASRKTGREALTGAHAGWVLSLEKGVSERRRRQARAEGNTNGIVSARFRIGSAGSQTPCMHGNSMHGNQEIPVLPAALRTRRAGRGTHKDKPFAHGAGKSDCCVVPEKVPNQGQNRRRGWREGGRSGRTQ
jgi:hypothetical protein